VLNTSESVWDYVNTPTGCDNDGESESGNYDDCNNSPWVWVYMGHDCNSFFNAGIDGSDECDNFDNANSSEGLDLEGEDGINDACSNGGTSESGIFDDCDNSINWVPAQGTEDIEQIGQENEPTEDDVAVGCTNLGESSSDNYLDCDNSIPNTSETLWDYGELWNHDGDVYIVAYCFSTNQDLCDYCANTIDGTNTDQNYDDCSGEGLLWMDWIPESGTPNVLQTGAITEPPDSEEPPLSHPTAISSSVGSVIAPVWRTLGVPLSGIQSIHKSPSPEQSS
jgi:hypothetical protein